jgi:5-oxoprolinase (ATP-hydrolysing) subunit A
MRIDLNGDVGERPPGGSAGHPDSGLIPHLTSASVACGFHAGDAGMMRDTIAFAIEHGVAVGAHPSFPDPEGFGRRELQFAPADVEDFVAFQVGTLAGIAASQGVRLQHVKPHGALFNMAAREAALADAVARGVRSIDPGLILFGLPHSQLIEAGKRAGLRTAAEGFADRAYLPDGSLMPRREPGAVIVEATDVISRVIRMARDRMVSAIDGSAVQVAVDTICVHGDTPGAADLAARIRAALIREGVELKSVSAA